MNFPDNGYIIPNDFVQEQKLPYSLIIALSAALLVSTGSALSVTTVGDLSSVESGPIITFVQPDKGAKDAAIAHHELLIHIRDSFKLSMTELAGVLHVSRAALYAWFQGSTPRPDLQGRLWQLKQYADLAAALNIDRLDLLIKLPLTHGKSLLQALSADEDVDQLISAVDALSRARAQSVENMRSSSSRKRISAAEQVTPVVNEFA